jgi:hypothetical protein
MIQNKARILRINLGTNKKRYKTVKEEPFAICTDHKNDKVDKVGVLTEIAYGTSKCSSHSCTHRR